MSIGPSSPLFGSAAGAPRAQSTGSDVQRAKQDAAARERSIDAAKKAAGAAGISKPDGEDHEPGERDADGRRPWEIAARRNQQPADDLAASQGAGVPSANSDSSSEDPLDLTV